MTPDLARCLAEQARCLAESLDERNSESTRWLAALGAEDWLKEEILIRMEEKLTNNNPGYVADALRTEPDYGPAIERLQDARTVRLLHVAMGLATEAGEFLDALKKHIFYGKRIDRVNLVEEAGDTSWYLRVGCDALEIAFEEMLLRNVQKLRARFPEKFSEEKANVRDLEGERKVLEGVARDWACWKANPESGVKA